MAVTEEFAAGLIRIAPAVPLGFPVAALVLAVRQGVAVASIAGAGMALISGTAYPGSVLPHWLRLLSYASLLTYGLRATRASVTGSGRALLTDAAVLVGLAVVLLALRHRATADADVHLSVPGWVGPTRERSIRRLAPRTDMRESPGASACAPVARQCTSPEGRSRRSWAGDPPFGDPPDKSLGARS